MITASPGRDTVGILVGFGRVLRSVGVAGTPDREYDLVFLDPPFALELWSALARQLELGGWLTARGWVYVESPRGNAPVLPPNWQLHREGQAGEVRFALYRRALPLS